MKTLLELLSKYTPSESYAQILDDGLVEKTRLDKEKRYLEVYASFPYLVDKEDLYAIEGQVSEAYQLSMFKIFPQYASELFSDSYIPQI